MSEQIGIGILAYYGLDDVQRAVASVREHTKVPYRMLVFDNSENFEVGEWLMNHAGDVEYMRSPYNVGCSRSRNRMAERFAAQGITHFVIMDQDVEVTGDGWAGDMLAVFERYPDTGIVGWELANRTFGKRHDRDETGVVHELPGMCNMYSLEAVQNAVPNGGWWPEYFMYLFDSDACFANKCEAAKKKLQTRVVNPDGKEDKLKHDHRNSGINRFPMVSRERARSRKIYAERVRKFGFPKMG